MVGEMSAVSAVGPSPEILDGEFKEALLRRLLFRGAAWCH